MSLIYQPAEDSFLICDAVAKLKNLNNKKILEMGSGSGVIAEALINNHADEKNLTLVDINLEAIKNLKQKFPKSKVVRSDLFKKIHGKFDLIIFNPPYLPTDKKEDKESKLATAGGKIGSEIINRFLKQANTYLEKNGKIILLTSSLTKRIDWQDYEKKILEEKKIFFEELVVWELTKY